MIIENLKAAGVQQAHKEDRITFTALTGWPGRFICAEGAFMEGDHQKRAGIFIGPEFGTVSRPDLVAAAREAGDAGFDVLIACAFNYDAHSAEFDKLGRVPVLKARMNPDLHMAAAHAIRGMFERFVELGSATLLTRELVAAGALNKRGKPIDKGFLYKALNNRVYLGEAVHKGTSYPGEHQAIIDQALWDKVRSVLTQSPRTRAGNTRAKTPALLKGLMFTEKGIAMTPTVSKKGSRLYRYYTSMDAIRNRAGENTETFVRLPAGMVETAVVQQIRTLLLTPEVTARAIEAAQRECPEIEQPDVVAALTGFDALWESLFPAEQARIARLLVERVTVGSEGMAVDLRTEGLGSVVREMVTPRREMAA